MHAPTVFIIDDHAAVRQALGEMLSVFSYTTKLYESADAFLNAVGSAPTGCVVADVRMPGTDGIQLVRELIRRGITIPVILISGHADVRMAVAAIKAGAQDFIEKPVDDAQLVAAINRCFSQAFDRLVEQKSLGELRAQFALLTPREVEVFRLVVQGYTSHAIAERLNISPRTVESYRVQIMGKMQAVSVAVLVRQAIRLGEISP